MNISFVSDAIYPYNKGGKEKRLYELSTRLAALGNDVHIYTMHWWGTPEKSRVENGVTLHAISKYYPMYKGDTRSIKEGIMFGLACFRLFRVPFDVLDVDHMPFFPIYSAWVVCTLRRRKFYGTWHEALTRQEWITYMGTAGNIASIIERVSVQLPHNIIAASNHTHERIQSKLRRSRRIDTVASGIDTKLIRRSKPIPAGCDVLYVGRLVKDKNIDKLVKAVALIAKKNPNVRCTVIGHGVEKDNITQLIRKLKLQKHITLLDPLPHSKDIYAHMKSAKVFCLPSVREGFGIVALEALGCGTPVVTVDYQSNAAKSLIKKNTGSVVPLKPSALAAAIESWINNAKPQNIAAQVANYDWNNLAQKQSEVYAS